MLAVMRIRVDYVNCTTILTGLTGTGAGSFLYCNLDSFVFVVLSLLYLYMHWCIACPCFSAWASHQGKGFPSRSAMTYANASPLRVTQRSATCEDMPTDTVSPLCTRRRVAWKYGRRASYVSSLAESVRANLLGLGAPAPRRMASTRASGDVSSGA